MQEIERLGYRNRFLPLIRAPKEELPPRGVWPHALARIAIFPDVIFEALRSKPSLVPSEETGEGSGQIYRHPEETQAWCLVTCSLCQDSLGNSIRKKHMVFVYLGIT
jgi:hypothetical protein